MKNEIKKLNKKIARMKDEVEKYLNSDDINYKEVFDGFYNDEFIPTNNFVLEIAYNIKYNKINSDEIYKMIDDFYKTREYNLDGTYLDSVLNSMKANSNDK